MKRLAATTQHQRLPRGSDLEAALCISLERVARGGEEALRVSRQETCPSCHGNGGQGGSTARHCDACQGSGHITHRDGRPPLRLPRITPCAACYGRGNVIDRPCPTCRGTGTLEREAILTVTIPAGIADETVLRLAGQGLPSPDAGGSAGDLLVRVRTQRDPRFERDGADLCHGETIALTDAVLGATRAVPTLEATASLRIPPGTQPGTVLHLPGQGLPILGSRQHGELQVRILVRIPEQLSAEERSLFERLRELTDTRAIPPDAAGETG